MPRLNKISAAYHNKSLVLAHTSCQPSLSRDPAVQASLEYVCHIEVCHRLQCDIRGKVTLQTKGDVMSMVYSSGN